ncbi:MAG: hypothetical protein IT436_12800 [Phycisphaerales bacterium]|nr:hypothetical protein [Phycisphaerales bacterium]
MSDSDPTPLPANRRYQCRGCQFNLTGLIIEDGKLTCPECGRSGSLAYVAEAEPPAPPSILRTLWRMCRWTTVTMLLSVFCATMSAQIEEFTLLSALLGMVALGVGILAPLLIAAEIVSNHERERRYVRALFSLTGLGILLNVTQVILIIIAFTAIVEMLVHL